MSPSATVCVLQEFKPEVMELVQALKQLEGYCSKQEFNNLCYCLTLDRLSQHPAFTSWTPHLGRLAVFATIKPYFESVAASQWTTRSSAETTPVPRNQLLVLLKQAAAMQVRVLWQLLPHPRNCLTPNIHASGGYIRARATTAWRPQHCQVQCIVHDAGGWRVQAQH